LTDYADNSAGDGLYEKPKDTGGTDYVQRWLEAIQAASDEEKDWRGHASDAICVYTSDEAQKPGTAFNLFHANVETVVPALYNSTPIPDVRKRYGDRDPIAKNGADAIERVLSYLIDEYDFDAVIESSVLHYALTGRGIARVHYNAGQTEDGMDVGVQTVTCRTVPWEAFRRGPAQCWEDVPWIAFRHYLTREDLEDLVGTAKAKDVPLNARSDASNDTGGDVEKSIYRRAQIWEIWEKRKREVIFLCDDYKDGPLLRLDDPLNLKDFFPVAKPLYKPRGDDTCVPLCPYQIQRPLLEEIDGVAKRIRNLIKQLRPRALGPGNIDIDALAAADDGQIVAVADIAAFLDSGGMDKLLAWFPMEPTVKAIQTLYEHRQIVKQDLFEVSGLADIMRGQSDARETKGAQQIKAQWGSLRIQRDQQEVQRFIRDTLRIKAELVSEKFTPENIGAMTGMELMPQAVMVLKDQKARDYAIDIETDSTIRGDLTRNMEQMAQFMQGTAQFMQALEPAGAMGVPPDVIVAIFSAFARNFKLGKEVDAILDALPEQIKQLAQQPKPPSPEEQKAQMEMQMMQAQAQMDQQKAMMELQAKQAELQMELKAMQAEMQLKAQEGQMKLALEREKMGLEQQKMQMDMAATAMQADQEMTIAKEQGQLQREEMHQSHGLKMQQAEQAAALKAKQMKEQSKTKAKAN